MTLPSYQEAITMNLYLQYPNIKMYDIMPLEESYVNDFIRLHQNVTQAGVTMNANYGGYGTILPYKNATVYKVWFNSTVPENPIALSQPPNLLDFRLEVQKSIDTAILQQKTGMPATINSCTKNYPRIVDLDENSNPELVASIGLVPILFGTHFFSIMACLYEINTDREKKLRQGLTMMGMKELSYWSHWFLTQAIFSAVSSLLVVIVGLISRLSFFTNTNFMVLFFAFWCYGMSSFAVAFIMSTFAKTPVKANGFAVMFFLIFLGLDVMFIHGLHSIGYHSLNMPFIGFILSLLPSYDFAQICSDIQIRSGYVQNTTNGEWIKGPGYKWDDLHLSAFSLNLREQSRTTSDAFGYMFLAMFIWSMLAWYIDNVRPGEQGSRKKAYFFFVPQYWGFGAKSPPNVAIYKHNMKKLSSVLPDMDKDLLHEHQATMAMAQSQKPGIVILKLSKTYEGGARALDNLTVSCEAGNVLCLLGHNGAGKTTAISLMTGLYEATSGDALIFGDSVVYEMDSIRKVMGVCPQHDILWDELTAAEHMRLFSKMKSVPSSERQIMERLKDVRLDVVADHLSSTFSGGMKRRLSVAIANIGDPKVIFMDEPTSGLDPRSRIQLAELIQKVKKDKIIVLTTHSMEEADALGDKIAIMALGRLRAVGDSLHLKARYGEGYHINLVCDVNKSNELMQIISTNFPHTKLTFQSAGNLIYTLPYSNFDDVTSFFQWIERDAPYITDWGVSHTTLEEVFLRITHGESIQENSTQDIEIRLEGIPDVLGSISVTPQTTLAEARRLIGAIPSAPSFYHFLSSPDTPIPPYQEHLKPAIRFAPALMLRPMDEKSMEKEEQSEKKGVEWEEEKREYVRRIRTLEDENNNLKTRVQELERLLGR
eukprot:Phypoly_transcript_01940.p1 GENE.Phypoly_transcript_01940~~Phypoly_transcript_01940.p1  ORF type:complete len:991 (+),score=123.87 Phypoly_transcript_01940:334-2973(+)